MRRNRRRLNWNTKHDPLQLSTFGELELVSMSQSQTGRSRAVSGHLSPPQFGHQRAIRLCLVGTSSLQEESEHSIQHDMLR